jgi:hypothetical protein
MKFGIATLLYACTLPLAHSLPLGGGGAVGGLGNTVLKPTVRDLNKQLESRIDTKTGLETKLQPLQRQTDQLLESLNTLPERLAIKDPLGAVLFEEVEIAPGMRIVEHEWLVWVASQQPPALQQADIQLLEIRQLTALNMSYLRLRTSATNDNRRYIESLFPDNTAIKIQRNFVFANQAAAVNSTAAPTANQPAQGPGASCKQAMKLGMIDTAISAEHPALRQAHITRQSFVADSLIEPLSHGTSIAALLVANDEFYQGVVPAAELYAASVFYQRDAYSQGATSSSLLKALNWLLAEQVSVINMSLAGPADPLLAFALQQINASNTLVVAAVGNAGPASAPLYPAAYDGVVAVTAIDKHQQIYRWAVQGEHVDIAAPGVKVAVARAAGDYGNESGTSLAAPIVAGFLACYRAGNPKAMPIEQLLSRQTTDLGKAGRDPVFGFGGLLRP